MEGQWPGKPPLHFLLEPLASGLVSFSAKPRMHPTFPGVLKEVHLPLAAPALGVEWDKVGPLRPVSVGHGSNMVKLAGSVGWAALGEMRLKVLLEEFEAELLTVALEHLGQGWGATEEDLHLTLLLSSHLLEHLSPHGVGESRGRGVSLWTRSGTHPAGADNTMGWQRCPSIPMRNYKVQLRGFRVQGPTCILLGRPLTLPLT